MKLTKEMLMEQFEYLLASHSGQCNIYDCPDCIRMHVISELLQRPFEQPQRMVSS